MNLLITNIDWDTDGHPIEECNLPSTVVMLYAPGEPDITEDSVSLDVEEAISTTLTEAFGFCHKGYLWERLSKAHDTHAGGGFFPERLGICCFPADTF